MFPQLIAGPIVRYSDIAPELKKRRHTLDASYQGACRFLIGLGKKILLANQLGALCQSYRASPESSVLYAWLYAVSYTLQIYFDFSGYSDMAIGLGSILGFHFPENFNYPYLSRSITEFWRRWHMTLGSWFRDYVYIPLGGNRVSQLKWLRNLLLVWGLTGLWHGAGWNFVFWGLYFALLLMGEKLFWGKFLQKSKLFSHIYVIFTILISFVLFNAESLGVFASDVGRMFGAGSLPFFNTESLYALRNHIFLLLFAILGATSLPKHLLEKCRFTPLGKVIPYLESVFLAVMLLLCTAYLVDGSFNPFLYFRF
jgi:alginate O-acetyltransferase complex protein AlgI